MPTGNLLELMIPDSGRVRRDLDISECGVGKRALLFIGNSFSTERFRAKLIESFTSDGFPNGQKLKLKARRC